MKILLVEDDRPIASVIQRGLSELEYDVDAAYDGETGLKLATQHSYSLIILDLMLPGVDGWKLCETLRSQHVNTPILMLTAKDTTADRVRGLETGADDYLVKPFEFDELVARVRALLRRDKVNKTRVIRVGDLAIDTGSHVVTRAGQEVPLTRREYALLEALASNEGRVLTREVIQEQVWTDDDSYSNTVDVYIGSLRKKVDAGHEDKLIQTVHGLGYTIKSGHQDKRT